MWRQYSPLEHGQVLNSGSPFAPLGATLGSKYEPGTLGVNMYLGAALTTLTLPLPPPRYKVSAAQIALGWVGQRGAATATGPMALVTRSANPEYLREDLALWNWAAPLDSQDREALDKIGLPACVPAARAATSCGWCVKLLAP